mgnify:CR=1 FL=1
MENKTIEVHTSFYDVLRAINYHEKSIFGYPCTSSIELLKAILSSQGDLIQLNEFHIWEIWEHDILPTKMMYFFK